MQDTLQTSKLLPARMVPTLGLAKPFAIAKWKTIPQILWRQRQELYLKMILLKMKILEVSVSPNTVKEVLNVNYNKII
jgi:hypothetical protein